MDCNDPDLCLRCALPKAAQTVEDAHAYALMLSRLAFLGRRAHEYLKTKGQSLDPAVTDKFDEEDYAILIECAEVLMRNAGRGWK